MWEERDFRHQNRRSRMTRNAFSNKWCMMTECLPTRDNNFLDRESAHFRFISIT